MSNTTKLVITLTFCLPALGGVSPIGIATSAGDIEVGQVRMPGAATLYEGDVVETANSPAQVNLRNGAVIRLGGGARAVVHANSLLLERGIGQVDAPGDYAIRARSVTLVPSSQPARARLQVSGDGVLQVVALAGSFDVHRLGAAAVGTVVAGTAFSFAPDTGQAGATAPAQFRGCLAKSDKGYLLQEDGSKAVLALTGNAMNGKSGDRVTVVGKVDLTVTPVAGTSEVIQVLRLTVDGHGCSSKAVLAAAGAKGTGTILGMSTPTAVMVGVAATSAAVVPSIALTSGGSSSSSISASSR